VSLEQAQGEGLYSTTANSIRMAADSTNVASGRGRNSIRVESKASYNHGLVILDLNHMPEGCGTWPAFWLLGPDWPTGGEVDIIEGVNSQAANSFAMHTSSGCSVVSDGSFSGNLVTPNCDVNAPGQGYNVGCSISTLNTQSYGTGFNNIQGGVYATEWTSDAITIWFFPRSQIPADITAGTPQPSTWGVPQARFAGACDIDTHFHDQKIVFTNTFCGDWAGQVWSQDSQCAPAAATCQDFVQNNPSQFQKAYWDINSLRVYQNSGSNNSPSVPVTSEPPTTPGGAVPIPGSPYPSPDPSTLVTVTLVDASSNVAAPQPQLGPSQSPLGAPAPPADGNRQSDPQDTGSPPLAAGAAAPAAGPAAPAQPVQPAPAQPAAAQAPPAGQSDATDPKDAAVGGGGYRLWNGQGWRGGNGGSGGGRRWWSDNA
jgi:hypothetical protein